MITFLVCLAALVTAYFTYGKYLERLADTDPGRATPARRMAFSAVSMMCITGSIFSRML